MAGPDSATGTGDAARPGERMVLLGRLTAVWGVKGWVKAESYTDPPDGLLDYRPWHLATAQGGWEPIEVIEGRRHGAARALVVRLAGVDDPDAARPYVQRDVAVPRSVLPPLGPGEFYWSDLPGSRVETLDGTELGVVSHFIDLPANPVMVVRGAGADGGAPRETWVPLAPGRVQRVEAAVEGAVGRVVVDWHPED